MYTKVLLFAFTSRFLLQLVFNRHFLTSSYDGNVRLFDYSQNLIHTAPIHAAPITSVCFVPSSEPSSNDDAPTLLATASHDLTARLTRLSLKTDDAPAETRPFASLHLHTAPLTSIAADSAGARLLTASWDGLLGVWDTLVPDTDEVPADPTPARQKKRRRLASAMKRKAPLAVLRSHTARVSRALFAAGGAQAVSVGFDATVRVWDIEGEVCTHTVAASEKPFLALALSGAQNQNTLPPQAALAAAADRTVTLYDLRATSTQSTSMSFAHPAVPAALAYGGEDQQFVSGAYDGVVRLWDLRSAAREMASFRVWEGKEGRKVLGVDWAGGVVGIAGEGGVEVWRVGQDAQSDVQ